MSVLNTSLPFSNKILPQTLRWSSTRHTLVEMGQGTQNIHALSPLPLQILSVPRNTVWKMIALESPSSSPWVQDVGLSGLQDFRTPATSLYLCIVLNIAAHENHLGALKTLQAQSGPRPTHQLRCPGEGCKCQVSVKSPGHAGVQPSWRPMHWATTLRDGLPISIH